VLQRGGIVAVAQHGLQHQDVSHDVLTDHVEREEWVAQMIEHTHEVHRSRRSRKAAAGNKDRRWNSISAAHVSTANRTSEGYLSSLSIATTRFAPRRLISMAPIAADI
jgi:hypothetical protein